MGLRDQREKLMEAREDRKVRESAPRRRFEYLARNLDRVPGMALEIDINKRAADGWRVVCEAKGYLILERELV
jgi:hypothetical protein